MNISKHVEAMPASGIRAMFDLAAKYDDVVSFCIGEPDFETPQNVIEAGKFALENGYTKYVPNSGIPELREAIAEKMRRENGIDVKAENVMINNGACQSLMSAMQVIMDAGDEIILPDPCFPNYIGQIMLVGAKAVMVGCLEENAFHIKAEDIEKAITPRTKAIVLNSPCNPTGAVLSESELKEIAEVVKKHDLIVISDEPYDTIVFDGKTACSIASFPGMFEHTITINSFSKSHAMTGWRVGYAVAPKNVIDAMILIQESLSSSVNAAAQYAAAQALKGQQETTAYMTAEYEKRRNLLVKGLNEIKGISCIVPEGAFYAFVNIKGTGLTSVELATKLIEEAQVVLTPGSAFGDFGEGYIRISYASSEEKLQEGINRMKKVLNK
ncbi:pyridoxal phosphate-dependent aminotransferase [Clostridium aminobutyricum]|uniref:Aminotransferase n=1 Tax=Clostridium aminobutyricum TaxID=33953 RepID=A0A939DA86_CLOAM|nr:pyridoxal phosphate-dependent aminotransferase [Clostridium aminobutyricum]MBN7774091.1 pyridoxal phosphate-dependent aminotransferase [Clostridium aminobutyricum]